MTTFSESAIEPYCELAKNSSGQKTVQVVLDALSDPNTFVFSELIEVDSVQKLNNSDFQKEYDALCLFAYGTYQDYKANPNKYPKLSEKQLYKLKQLSVITLSETQRILTYKHLLKILDIQNVRDLEDLLIDTMYHGLFKGKLDQKQKTVEVLESIGRDVKDADISKMIKTLSSWADQTMNILTALEKSSQESIKEFEENKKQREAYEEKIEDMKKNIKASLELSSEMEFDDPRHRQHRQ